MLVNATDKDGESVGIEKGLVSQGITIYLSQWGYFPFGFENIKIFTGKGIIK